MTLSAFLASTKQRLGFLGTLFAKSADRFDDLEGFRLGAAFSYYATFAIFPLVLLTVTVVGFLIGDDAPTRERILSSLGGADASTRDVIAQTLTSMQTNSGARKASAVIGLLSLLFSASGAFVELDFSLNKIWQVKPRCGKGIVGKVKIFLAERLSGFACVAGIGLFMIASLVSSSTLNALAKGPYKVPALLHGAEVAVSIALLAAAIAAAFHFVPRSRPPFRDVIGGAVLTTVLLTLLKSLFAVYLSHLTSYSAYGVVGGVLALATWIYLSSQVIFFGATLTRVHGELRGPADASKQRAATAPTPMSQRPSHDDESSSGAHARAR